MAIPPAAPETRSVRLLKVGEQVRHAISELLTRQEVHDEVLASHAISITEVRMSPDLRHATVLIMPLGGKTVLGELGEAEAVAALNRNTRELRGEVSRRLRELKFSPELRFRVDDRYDEAERIEKIFEQERVNRDLEDKDMRVKRDLEDQ